MLANPLTLARTLIGEQSGGPLSDFLINKQAKKIGHRPEPEYRLWLSHLGYGTVIVGLIVFGIQLENATPKQWNITPIIGAALIAFGKQIVTTVLITCKFFSTIREPAERVLDAVDCHPEEGSSVGSYMNLVHLIWGFVSSKYRVRAKCQRF
jgi:hypothetical protein